MRRKKFPTSDHELDVLDHGTGCHRPFIGVFLPLKQKALSKGVEKCELSGLHNKTFVARDERWLNTHEWPLEANEHILCGL